MTDEVTFFLWRMDKNTSKNETRQDGDCSGLELTSGGGATSDRSSKPVRSGAVAAWRHFWFKGIYDRIEAWRVV